ncbi:hypothetical protein GCM10009547_11150 [Sporichthya brevicatena]|uniref:Uncharacterized protein n=1 Tax=Sporichthya brevicatena TaxID=171442 RepID=A0ABP3RIE2_9ACTN
MKRYFRRAAESSVGEGLVFFEFDGDWAIRQVEIYGDRWFDSRRAEHTILGPGLIDQPLSELDLCDEDVISADDFVSGLAESRAPG